MGKLKKWILNVLIGIDQLVNAILFGDPDETLSSRMGKHLKRWKKNPQNKGRYFIALSICWLLNIIDPNHCEKSIEDDEGKDSLSKVKG